MRPALPLLLLTFALGACAGLGGPWKEGDGWKLVWADEFDAPGAPDPTKWSYEVGHIRNNELQYYTQDRRENARVENGRLVIEARKEAWQGSKYTSASLHTHGKAQWTYGRFEVRAKVPAGRGMWPAAWMLGTNIGQAGWPLCGEIDLMENVGFDPHVVHFNVHTKAFNHMIGTNKGASVPLRNPHADFHTYAAEWGPRFIRFFLDGRQVFVFHNDGRGVEHWPYDKPQYLILNSAIGGAWGGMKGVDDSIFPTRYEVDYVRVYQRQ
jgi:beta-glucanase (GH16 family)